MLVGYQALQCLMLSQYHLLVQYLLSVEAEKQEQRLPRLGPRRRPLIMVVVQHRLFLVLVRNARLHHRLHGRHVKRTQGLQRQHP